jgi:hypothetical protein
MRLSDARVRQRQAKLIYRNHRFPPWLTEDAVTAIARTDCQLLALTAGVPNSSITAMTPTICALNSCSDSAGIQYSV